MLGVGYTSALVHNQNDEGITYINKIALLFILLHLPGILVIYKNVYYTNIRISTTFVTYVYIH